ncbi:MAG: hypothetical protein PV344_06130, partial [Anaplasma sp.]|nr:hypothetical protein [Anaplasma sp.]
VAHNNIVVNLQKLFCDMDDAAESGSICIPIFNSQKKKAELKAIVFNRWIRNVHTCYMTMP